ncbi:hypothetical protein CNMCM5623_007763 [Aspergillus felis]|uniref:Uncharacterized protein n=1 Tax=Aspergillus felis TaxID=1287682 RepID=A0A8H6V3C5_9EURO|nr:hypothetical protein CNMCM5623_007763 [Aspergillus felis]KAF7176457.1 hypothetical protein CNMCM7691_002775 [Aspergillus felis]
MSAVHYLLDGVSVTIATLLIYTGIRCFQNPLSLAKTFGLPTATADEVVFFQSSTGRNIGAGLFIYVMTYLQERRLLGIFFLCWSTAGMSDTKLLLEHPRGQKIGMHIRNTCVLLVLGPLLIKFAS